MFERGSLTKNYTDEVRWVYLKVSQQVELLPVGFLVWKLIKTIIYLIPVVRNFNEVK